MRECWFVRDTSSDELRDPHELGNCSAFQYSVNLALAIPSYNTRSARGQASSAHDGFCKESIENSVQFMRNVIVPGEHFCLNLMFFHWDQSLHRQTKMVQNAKAGLEGSAKGFGISLKQETVLPSARRAPGIQPWSSL